MTKCLTSSEGIGISGGGCLFGGTTRRKWRKLHVLQWRRPTDVYLVLIHPVRISVTYEKCINFLAVAVVRHPSRRNLARSTSSHRRTREWMAGWILRRAKYWKVSTYTGKWKKDCVTFLIFNFRLWKNVERLTGIYWLGLIGTGSYENQLEVTGLMWIIQRG